MDDCNGQSVVTSIRIFDKPNIYFDPNGNYMGTKKDLEDKYGKRNAAIYALTYDNPEYEKKFSNWIIQYHRDGMKFPNIVPFSQWLKIIHNPDVHPYDEYGFWELAKIFDECSKIGDLQQEKLPKSDTANKVNSSTVCDQFKDNGSPTTKVSKMQDAEFVGEMKKIGEIDGSGSDAEFVKKLKSVDDTLARDLEVSNVGKVGEIDGSGSDNESDDGEAINQEYLGDVSDLDDLDDDSNVPFKTDYELNKSLFNLIHH